MHVGKSAVEIIFGILRSNFFSGYTGARLDYKRNDDARSSPKSYRDAQDDFASVSNT